MAEINLSRVDGHRSCQLIGIVEVLSLLSNPVLQAEVVQLSVDTLLAHLS